jgi:Superinfection immunity protein
MALGVLYFAILVAVYWLPAYIAHRRRVPNSGSVAVINGFPGWTVIGWIVALAMACRTVSEEHLREAESRRWHERRRGQS